MSSFKYSRLALGVLTLAVTACAPAPVTAPPVTGGSTAPVTAAESPAASPVASTAPTPSAPPQAGASTVPLASAPAPDPNRRVIVSGRVYDLEGAAVDGAIVRMRSLDASVPYEASTRTVAGSYVFNNVPEGANMAVTATRDGWTTRTRVASFQGASTERKVLNFGTQSSAGGDGAAYFISKYPEIMATSPLTDAPQVDPTSLSYTLTLSEPLDDTNKRRFEQALRVLPANDAANGDVAGSTRDLEAQEDRNFPFLEPIEGNTAQYPYMIKQGAIFLDDSSTRASVSWNADNTVATFSFKAPLVSNKSEEAAYQVGLVAGQSSQRIQDPDGNQLGTDQNGRLSGYPAAGHLILSAFKAADLALANLPGLTNGSTQAKWAATHENVATFDVREDKTAPTLVGVTSSEIGPDTRIELTFSEPMAAYNGTDEGLFSAEFSDANGNDPLANLSFAVGERPGDVEDVDLEGAPALSLDPRTDTRFATNGRPEREFRFAAGAFVAERAGAAPGSITIAVDPKDAKRVLVTLVDRRGFFERELSAIKARVAAVADPAGNAITASQADRHIATGSL